MKATERRKIEKAIITIGEIINFEACDNWDMFKKAVIAKNAARDRGDEKTAQKFLNQAKSYRLRRDKIATIQELIKELDFAFHNEF